MENQVLELNPEKDLEIEVSNLSAEFRNFAVVMYRYSVHRAKVESRLDIAKAKLDEVKAMTYKNIKSNVAIKHTEKSIEAEIDTDPAVQEAQRQFIKAKHDAATWAGAVDSMRAKKDCLIQLGSDRRKEV